MRAGRRHGRGSSPRRGRPERRGRTLRSLSGRLALARLAGLRLDGRRLTERSSAESVDPARGVEHPPDQERLVDVRELGGTPVLAISVPELPGLLDDLGLETGALRDQAGHAEEARILDLLVPKLLRAVREQAVDLSHVEPHCVLPRERERVDGRLLSPRRAGAQGERDRQKGTPMLHGILVFLREKIRGRQRIPPAPPFPYGRRSGFVNRRAG